MWPDFINNGTALAPPLVLIMVLALFTLGVHLSGWIQLLSGILLAVLALVMIVGAAGELMAPASPDVPRAVQLTGGANAALAAALFATPVGWACRTAARQSGVEGVTPVPIHHRR